MTHDVPALKICSSWHCSNGCTHASYHPNPTFPMRLQHRNAGGAHQLLRPPWCKISGHPEMGTRDGGRVRQPWLLVSRHQTFAYTDMIYQLKYCCITAAVWIRMNRVSGYLHLQQASFDSLLQASVQLIRCFSLRSLWRTKWTSCHLARRFVGATRPTLGLQQFKTIWPFGNIRVCQTPADWEIHQLSGSWICIISVLQRNTGTRKLPSNRCSKLLHQGEHWSILISWSTWGSLVWIPRSIVVSHLLLVVQWYWLMFCKCCGGLPLFKSYAIPSLSFPFIEEGTQRN